MSRFDVAIIGGGPAGAWAAYRLARGGANVAIVDGSHPREKPCGGGVTGRALALVQNALADQALASVTIDSASFSYRGKAASCALHNRGSSARRDDFAEYPPLVVVSRRDFDAALLDGAIRAGARLLRERAIDVRATGRSWNVATRGGDLHAEWIVGADGTNSLVRRRVSRPFDRSELSIAAGYFVHGVSAGTSNDVDLEFMDSPDGYLWSFPRADHLAVGVCAQADSSTASALQGCSAAWIAANVPEPYRLERYSWPIPSLSNAGLRREHPSGPGWVLVGDAAGLVDSITREGIYFALRSADHAADSLLGPKNPADVYVRRLRDDVYPELQRAARLRARFFRPHFMSLLITALLQSGRIRNVMADLVAGRQTYRGLRRHLLRTFEWRLMMQLFGTTSW